MNNTQIRIINRGLFFVVIFAALALGGCSRDDGQMMAESGQCWSQKGGVGNLLKNSSTKAECEELGGKSWCPMGGGCENL